MKKLFFILIALSMLFGAGCEDKRDKNRLNLDPPKKSPLDGPGKGRPTKQF